MKSSFLLMIFRPPFSADTFDKVAQQARDLHYTMFCFNGIVYESRGEKEVFLLSDLIN